MRTSPITVFACVAACAGSALGSEAYLTNWYPPSGDNALYEWHVGSAGTTRIGGIDLADTRISGLAWDSAQGVMYGMEALGSRLCTVDLTTGHATVIADTGAGFSLGLAISQDRVLYSMAGGLGQLVSIDPTTGVGTPIGGTRGHTFGALTFAPDGRLLGSLAGPGGGGLYEIDVTTGAESLIYTCPSLSGIAFDPEDGQMYGIDLYLYRAYRIDFATGAFTTIGQFNPDDLLNPAALAFVPAPGGAAVMMIGGAVVGGAMRRRPRCA